MFGISGFIEAAPTPKKRHSGKRVHPGHYPTRGDMDFMDPGEIDYMKYEYGLMRHHRHPFRTFGSVYDGEQQDGDPNDFRDHFDSGDERLPFEGINYTVPDKCGCDPEKDESCLICCVKLSPSSVTIITETVSGRSLCSIELSDKRALKLGFLGKRTLKRLHRNFKQSSAGKKESLFIPLES